MSHISITASFWVIAAGILIWLGAAWLCWANWQRSGNRRATGLLEAIRFLLITMIVATLLRPEFVQQIKRTETMGAYKPSTLLGLEAGRALEIEAIWGEPLRRAQAQGAAMPRWEELYTRLKTLDAQGE